jgi:hypothetical protein
MPATGSGVYLMPVIKVSEDQWADVYAVWRKDPRDGYAWLIRELNLPVSGPAVRKRALKEGWVKNENLPKTPAKTRHAAQNAVSAKAGKPKTKPKTTAKTKNSGKPDTKAETETAEPCAVTEVSVGDENDGNREEGETKGRNSVRRLAGVDPGIHDFQYGSLIELMGPMPGNVTKYRPEFAVIAFRFMLLGSSIENLAKTIGVDRQTIYNWEKAYDDFSAALRSGREAADTAVAARLFQRAMGYTYEAEEIKIVEGQIERVTVTKHHPPDPQSAMFWLKNRQPEMWKDKVEVVEKPTIALVDKEKMDEVYDKVLQQAAETQERMLSRAERLGLVMDGDFRHAGEDD